MRIATAATPIPIAVAAFIIQVIDSDRQTSRSSMPGGQM
jgi:hypothetical protein